MLSRYAFKRIRQRAVELDTHRQDVRTRGRRRMLTGHLDLAADHLAPARFRGEEDDQELGLPNLRLDLAAAHAWPDGQPADR